MIYSYLKDIKSNSMFYNQIKTGTRSIGALGFFSSSSSSFVRSRLIANSLSVSRRLHHHQSFIGNRLVTMIGENGPLIEFRHEKLFDFR